MVSPRVETAPEYEITLPIDDLLRGLDLQPLMDASSSADDEMHQHQSSLTARRMRPGELSFVSTTRSVSVCGTPLQLQVGAHTRSFISAATYDSVPANPLNPPSGRTSFASHSSPLRGGSGQATGSGGGGGGSGAGNV